MSVEFFFFTSFVFIGFIQWFFFPFIGRKFIYPQIMKYPSYVVTAFEIKITSSIIAVLVAVPTAIVFLTTPELFPGLQFFHESHGVHCCSAIYLGYIVCDSFSLLYTRKSNNEFWTWVIHHILGFISPVISIFGKCYGLGPVFIMMTEFTTPFANNIFFLKVLDIEGQIVIINNLILIFLWIVFRLLIGGIFMLYFMISDFQGYIDRKRPYIEIFGTFFITIGFIFLNCWWFFKLVKGFLRYVKKERQRKLEEDSKKSYRRKLY